MNILVLGSGGRECAIVDSLSRCRRADSVYAMPGNGGIRNSIPGSPTDKEAVLAACRRYDIGLCCVTPDDPLAVGMVDHLEANGIPCFGPTQAAARIESSKVFSKALMEKYGIPTAKARSFDRLDEALAYVVIAKDKAEAQAALHDMMEAHRFGQAGSRVLIEEFLTGPEVSILSFTDGHTIVPMVSSMDHKRAYDGDEGPNTGGMGTVAPNPYYTEDVADECMERIFLPTIRAMETEGCPFRGCLYFGLMLTAQGPKVIEYNARFGDPETQVVLPLLEGDLLEIMLATREGRLKDVSFSFSSDAACCVVMASAGYPGSYEKGKEITIDDGLEEKLFIAGAVQKDGRLITSGGRVLGLTARAATLPEAMAKAYEGVSKIHFAGAFFRHDIGRKALEAK